MVLLINQQKTVWLPLRTLNRQLTQILALSGYANWDLGVHFVTNHDIQQLNNQYRGKPKPTDILSFPFHNVYGKLPEIQQKLVIEKQKQGLSVDDYTNLGDMFLSIPFIVQDCRNYNERLFDRLPVLFTHGICHLLGYDHESQSDYEIMHKKERSILEKLQETRTMKQAAVIK